MRHIAKEGGCFVIGTATALQASDVPENFPERAKLFPDPDEWICDGDAVIVEVDPVTAAVAVQRYVVVHDCGRVIHHVVVEGQITGGVIQGLGGALLEQLVYEPSGQLISGSFADYLLPRAPDAPSVEVFHHESPSPLNPLGIKGVGEGGTIPVAAAIAAAVEDALSPFGIRITESPLTPDRLRRLLQEAGQN